MKKKFRLFYALSTTLSLLIPLIPWSLVPTLRAEEPATSAVAAAPFVLSQLQLKEKRLNAELKSLDKNDPDFLILTQSIRDELTAVQRQIQEARTAAIPRSFSELGPMVPEESAMTPQQALPNQQALPTRDLPLPEKKVGAQEGQLPVGPVNLFAQIQEELNLQLKQVRQMRQSIGGQDGRLAAALQGQENDILNQLREVDRQITEMNATQGSVLPSPRPTDALGTENAAFPDKTSAKSMSDTASTQAESTLPVNGAGNTGANQLPASPAAPIPPKSTYTWAPVAGNEPALSSARDPFAAAPSPEVLEIKKMVTELKEEMTKLQAELTAINTQLRLLSFRVAGEQPAPAATQNTAAAQNTTATPPGADTAVKAAVPAAKPNDSSINTDKK